MFAVSVVFTIKQGHVDEFFELIQQHANRTLAKEDGCIRFDVGRDAERPSLVFVYELFINKEAFDVHSKADYLSQFFDTAGAWIASKEANRWSLSPDSAV